MSAEGTLQAEVLTNTEDSIEIGLFNQEDHVTAKLMWDVKAKTGNVILNLNTEDEKTVPMSASGAAESPEKSMETLADGLFLMANQTDDPLSPEESEFKSGVSKDSKASKKVSRRAVTTSGWMVPHTSHIPPYNTEWKVASYNGQPNSHPHYYGGLYN